MVGSHLAPVYVWSAAAAAWYLPISQLLFFPHRKKRVLTSHVALINVAIQISLVLAMAGLFVLVGVLVLLVEWWLFPTAFIESWFQHRGFVVGGREDLHLAVVVSTLGTLTGALGGGFHGRDIIRELALFLKNP